jgi:hypothetical protein
MSYREERRADQVAERAQDREDRRLELEARLAADAQRAEQRRLDDAAKEEKERLRAEAQRRQQAADRRARQQEAHRRRAARRARLAKATRWLNANPVTVFVGFVMASSVIPAVISQVGALGDAHVNVFLAALLASMLEGGAWALTFMGKAAEDAGRPAGKYRVATWCTAVLAATVQYWHWSAKLPGDGWVAVVFAASSLFAIYLWDMKTHGSHGRTRAERREDRARRRHAAEQRRHHRKIAKEADRLRAAMPFGAITESDAFTAAWRIEYGTDPGMTPETYSRLTAAQVELEQAFRIAEEERPVTMRAGLLEGVLNPLRPVPQLLGEALPALGPSVPVARLDKITEGRTAQAGIGSYASEQATARGPQRAAAQGAKPRAERAQKAPQAAEERPLEQLMPKARIVAAELVAEGMQISATSLAKRLQIRRQDAIRLRDMVVAERKADATLHLVPEREAAS